MQHRRARGPIVGVIRLATLLLTMMCAAPAWAQIIVPPVKPPVKPPETKPQPGKPAEPKLRGPTTIEAQSIEGVPELEVTARGAVV
ncbi:MAG: hypothetical protein ACRD3R_15750, partial [Terriglobales bacterium]